MNFKEYGFQYPANLILSFIGGSQLHGAKAEGTDDTDWYGVFIEPPEKVLGLDRYEHFVYTTGGLAGGNGPGDVDVTLFSLRKWAGLAVKGNPTALHFLYAPPSMIRTAWWEIERNAHLFLAKGHLSAFTGYARQQLQRLFDGKQPQNIHRAHLVEKYGYDCKFAFHCIRLLGEGKELMEHGRITHPQPNVQELISIRNGKYRLSHICEMAEALETDARAAQEKSSLPEEVDREQVSRLLAEVYRGFWAQQEHGGYL